MSVNGAWLGAKTAFWLSLIYGWGFLLLNMGNNPTGIIILFFVSGFISLFIAGVGAMLGGLIEWDLQQAKITSSVGAILVGLAVAAGPALALHLIFLGPTFNIDSNSSTLSSEYHEAYFTFGYSPQLYFIFLGWPSLIATLASGWMGWRINTKLQAKHNTLATGGFASLATVRPVEIKDYIVSRRDTHSRYEIDLDLIRRGHDPQTIETTWQALVPPNQLTLWQKLGHSGLRWPVILLLVSGFALIFDPILAATVFVTGLALESMVWKRSHFVAGLIFCVPFYWWLVRLFILG